MTLPEYFTVLGDFRSVVADLATDLDYDPQIGPVTATVTFKPVLRDGDAILATDATPRPTGYIAAPITAKINSTGRLVLRDVPDGTRQIVDDITELPGTGDAAKYYIADDTGVHYRWNGVDYDEILPYAPVRLLADTPLLELATPLYYTVTFSSVLFNGRAGKLNGFTFAAPNTGDAEVNLIEVMRQPGQPAAGGTKVAPNAIRTDGEGNLIFSFDGVDIPDPVPFPAMTNSYSETIGNGATTSLTVDHELGTMDVLVSVHNVATGEEVDCDVVKSTGDRVILTFATPPALNSLRCTVLGTAFGMGSPRPTDSTGITDATATGRALITADDAAAARVVLDVDTATATGTALITATDAADARAAINADFMVNAKDFGAVGDGTVDDTEALQDWLDYLVANTAHGFLPNGTYKITDTLVSPSAPTGFSVTGETGPIISQATNNIPVLTIGTSADSTRGLRLENLALTYAWAQPSTNTNANCLVFDGPGGGATSTAYAIIHNVSFSNGYYAMKVPAGQVGVWASDFDNLYMQGMSGGFYDNTGSIGGVPNNKWGRLTLYCDDCVGPIFKNWNTYNTTIGAIEFLRTNSGAQLITAVAGFGADIGSIKLELGTYTAAGSLIQLPSSHWLRIGDFRVDTGTNVNPASGTFAAISIPAASNTDSLIDISSIRLRATTLSGNCVAFSSAGTYAGRIRVGAVELGNGWTLHDRSATPVGNSLIVNTWVNGILTTLGDADYTVTLGDPNVVQFATAFTAQRTITLPSQTSNNTCAGLYYDLIFDGAINGANTAVIKQGASTIRTQTVDKKRLRYAWRRSTWVLVDVSDLQIGSLTFPTSTDTVVGRATTDTLTGKTINLAGNTVTGTMAQFNTAVSDADLAKTSNVQVFTADGTWTKPANAVSVRVRCIGAGGGGGSGARGPSGTALSGGGGGASGGMSEMVFAASDLGDTVAVTVGAGGVGGAAQTSDGTAGAAGGAGFPNTTFGSHLFAGRGGAGGGGGLASAGTAGSSTGGGFSYGMQAGGGGAAGSATGAAGATAAASSATTGGGGGGGITTGATANAGGAGGLSWSSFGARTTTPVGAAGGSGADGTDGTASAIKGPGIGGGGGSGNAAGAGYDGGDGGIYGGGGGGGGASLNGSASGAGGKGGDGICIVHTYF